MKAPCNPIQTLHLPASDSILGELRLHLTYLNSLGHNAHAMPLIENVASALCGEILSKSERLNEIQDEMLKLQRAYDRYRELTEEAEEVKEEIREAAAVLGPEEFESRAQPEYADIDTGLPLPVEELREKLSLWRAMVRIVKYAPWIQIVELQCLLRELGIIVSRAATESALSLHKKDFRIKRKGREKFVALK